MVKRRVELVALCLSVLLYTGLLPVYSRNPFSCVLNERSVSFLSGTVVSSPVKTSSGKSYSLVLSVSEASSKETLASCTGNVTLYVPAADIEALYPGKLFSTAEIADKSTSGAAVSSLHFGDALESDGGYSDGSAPINALIEEGCHLSAEVSYSGMIDGDYLSVLSGNIERPAFYAKRITECSWNSALPYIRAYLRLQLRRLLAAWGVAGGLLLALVCGSREYTDSAVSESFKNAGLSHILALSGMHLALFAGLSEKSAGKLVGKRFSPFLSLASSFVFVWFAGLSPSLLRALICMCIGFAATLLGLRTTPVKTLCLAFIIHLVIAPSDAGSLAFMLSYLALLGVHAGNHILSLFLSKVVPVRLSSAFSASVGAQVLTLPLTVTAFSTFVPVAIFASVVVSPVASIFVTGGIIAVAFVLIMPFLLQPLGYIISMLYYVLTYAVRFFADFPRITI